MNVLLYITFVSHYFLLVHDYHGAGIMDFMIPDS